jgi:hypothetical protein
MSIRGQAPGESFAEARNAGCSESCDHLVDRRRARITTAIFRSMPKTAPSLPPKFHSSVHAAGGTARSEYSRLPDRSTSPLLRQRWESVV